MQRFARASLLLAVTLLAASCSDTDARLAATQPSDVGTAALVVSPTSPTVSAEPVNDPVCPIVTPFRVPLGVVVSENGASVAVISSIRAQFIDTTGRQAPPLTVPMPQVTHTFGVPTAELFQRTFPFFFGIGCGTGSRGTVFILVEGTDRFGRRVSGQTTVIVQ